MRVAVDVWRIDLVGAALPSPTDLDLLSDEEGAHYARYLVPEPARIFATTRIALRRILARELACDAAALRIGIDAAGKPFLRAARAPFFNISHCASSAAIAMCACAEVGVDVEDGFRSIDDVRLASSIASPSELTSMGDLEPSVYRAQLARLWCRKEALMKATGTGLARRMSNFDLGPPIGTSGTFVDVATRVVWLDMPWQGTPAALAVVHAEASTVDLNLRCWPV